MTGINCPLGWSSEEGSSRCLACDAGKVQISILCEDCPINTYTNQKAQISTCKDCDDAANSVKGSSVCVKCDVGQYMAAGSSRICVDCPAGQFSNYGKRECTECDQGTYADKTIAATGCKSCPSGQYGSGVVVADRINEGGACKKCVTGKYSKAEGADSNETCIDCQPGKKSKDVVAATEEAEACTECLVGKYRSSTDTDLTKCRDCTLGTFADAKGLTKCLACAAGTYSDVHVTQSVVDAFKDGEDFCKDCVVGQHRPSKDKDGVDTDLTKCK